jgi:hypothetical protein
VNHLGRWDEGPVSRRGMCHGFHQEPEDRTEFRIVRIARVAVKWAGRRGIVLPSHGSAPVRMTPFQSC